METGKFKPGWLDNDGVLRAIDPVTWHAAKEGKQYELTDKQRERVREAWDQLTNEPKTVSVMYDCQGEFFKVVRLTPEDWQHQMPARNRAQGMER